ncbi:MAG: ribonuclease Z, partial [Pyrinomonadaceae bacterium]|nr:ribonuclease Z [Pyrinomonadaceae bacterium]
MQLTFLGTGAGVPTRARNVSAVALRLDQRAEVWLFDCGEGTQHQF